MWLFFQGGQSPLASFRRLVKLSVKVTLFDYGTLEEIVLHLKFFHLLHVFDYKASAGLQRVNNLLSPKDLDNCCCFSFLSFGINPELYLYPRKMDLITALVSFPCSLLMHLLTVTHCIGLFFMSCTTDPLHQHREHCSEYQTAVTI